MKTSALLFVLLFLMPFKMSFGDESSYVGNFSDYVNSPEGPSGSPVDKNIKPVHSTNLKTKKNPVKAGPQQVLQGIPAKWKACVIDSDCTAGVVDCVSWEPLNKKYLSKLSKNLNSCSASIDPGFQPEAVCVAKACKTTEKTTDVSWEEWLSEMHKDLRPQIK